MVFGCGEALFGLEGEVESRYDRDWIAVDHVGLKMPRLYRLGDRRTQVRRAAESPSGSNGSIGRDRSLDNDNVVRTAEAILWKDRRGRSECIPHHGGGRYADWVT